MSRIEDNVVITVRQAMSLLGNALNVCVLYDGEEYDITEGKKFVMDTFGEFVVDEISSVNERKYTIFLKQEYVRVKE